jgi:hypothetical protein
MEIVEKYRGQAKTTVPIIHFPWHIWSVRAVVMGLTVLVGSVIIATNRETADPFSMFSDLLGDDISQSTLADGFNCYDTVRRGYAEAFTGYCVQYDLGEIFSQIDLRISSHVVREINFSLKENALRLGDLALLWGKPHIQLYCESVVAAWPTHHIMAVVSPPQDRYLSYFSPVISVSLTRSSSPHWKSIMINDVLHHCGGVKEGLLTSYSGWR